MNCMVQLKMLFECTVKSLQMKKSKHSRKFGSYLFWDVLLPNSTTSSTDGATTNGELPSPSKLPKCH
jgi:hypothetical protein